MMTSQKIIFFGTEDFSFHILQGLIDAGYLIAAVVTKPDTKKGRGQKLTPPAVKQLALQHDIPVWQPVRLQDIYDDVRHLSPVAGVLVSYGKIIPEELIGLFTPGIINVHPSLLPLYRGPSPIESAILSGDAQTGVTIMQLSKKMDAGPIYGASARPLTGTETRQELYTTLANRGTNLLLELLPGILRGDTTPSKQDDSRATYCQLLQKSDAALQPTTMTATQAERQVRAYLGFPKSKLKLLDHECIITKCHVEQQTTHPLAVRFVDGKFLCVDELVAPSGKTMNAESFVRGYKLLS